MKKTILFFIIVTMTYLHLFVAIPAESAPAPTISYLEQISSQISTPSRITTDLQGNIYITDPRQWIVQTFSVVGDLLHTMRIPNHALLGIGVAANGDISTGDNTNKSVSIYSSSGVFLRKVGTGDGEVFMPNDIAIDHQTHILYVSDSLRNEVRAYNPNGTLAFSIQKADASTNLNFPTGIAIDPLRRELIVGDHKNSRIHIYDLQGSWRRSFGSYGAFPGQFTRIQGIAVDRDSRIYIVDSLKNTVQVFDFEGTFLTSIGKYGKNPGDLFTPMDVVMDKYNRLLITSTNTSRVEIYSIDGGGFDYDGDHDGMADYWEDTHGLIVGINDAALDPDQDGLTNLREYHPLIQIQTTTG